jgi:hypothetical protein
MKKSYVGSVFSGKLVMLKAKTAEVADCTFLDVPFFQSCFPDAGL